MKFYSIQSIIGIQIDETTGSAALLIRDKDAVLKVDIQNKHVKIMTPEERAVKHTGDIQNF